MRPLRAESRTRPVAVRLSNQEFSRAMQAALLNRQPVSTFIRDAIVIAAEDCLEDEPQLPAK